jgi:hypothetical protein
MLDKQWLSFQQAVALVCELRGFGGDKSMATVKRAIDSGEVGHSFAEQHIVKEETQGHQELSESVRREASARNFKMSGSALDILRSRAQQAAYERAARRLRRLVTDIGSPEFYEALMTGDIRISRKGLFDWLEQELPKPNSVLQSNRRYPEDAALVQEAVDGLSATSPRWPNAHQAAIALQSRAKGASDSAKIDRLERAIRKASGKKRRVRAKKKKHEAS